MESKVQMETTLDRNLQQQNVAQHTACAQSAARQSNGARTRMQARGTRGRAGMSGGSEHAARQEEQARAQARRAESTSQQAPRVKVKTPYQLLTGNNKNKKKFGHRLQQRAPPLHGAEQEGARQEGARGVSAWG